MAVTIGMGDYIYQYQPDWARLPSGMEFQTPSAVAVDSQDRVYVYQRHGPPVLVFDSGGGFLSGWPRQDSVSEDAHHIYISPDDDVYLADRDAHQVLKFTTDGELVMTLGHRDKAALQAPFNHPSDIAVAPSGEIYVSDGYGNSCVHRFTNDGAYISSFGAPGNGPGEFLVPHSIRIAADGRVYVCDRENNRVQVFSQDGEFLDQWTDFKGPMGIHIDANQTVYVTDQIPRISILDLEGRLLARGRTFEYGHNVYTDSQGNIYAVDVANQRVQKFVKQEV
ncbi:MAG: hypothetical protein BZY81_04725 [SAR202 cluster bacterium Io17-Chloro-G4]|nr:MAG: hypothetical protein BZY81_04725 [SAR202 cluster bacterium Io17-Chloro-G4]